MTFNHFENHDRWATNSRGKALYIVGHVLVGLIFAVAFAIVFAVLVKLIWNGLMPAIFGLTEITYWQAFGIIILAKLLFGGFGARHRDHWSKSKREHFPWTKPADESNEERPPRRYDRNWKTYTHYWREEGKAAFDAYMDRVQNQKNKAD